MLQCTKWRGYEEGKRKAGGQGREEWERELTGKVKDQR